MELHPYFHEKIISYCQQQDIMVACWSPLGTGSWSGVKAEDKPFRILSFKRLQTSTTSRLGHFKWDLENGHITLLSRKPKTCKANLR